MTNAGRDRRSAHGALSRVALRCWAAGLSAVLVAGVTLSTSSPSGASPRPHYQDGISTYFPYGCEPISQVEDEARIQFTDDKALHANAVGIAFPIYDNTLTSSVVYAKLVCGSGLQDSTPPVSVLEQVVRVAHSLGLHVLLRPSLDQSRFGPFGWSGIIKPTDVAQWFTTYMATIRPYLVMAQREHVEHFAIESEINSLAARANWKDAIWKAKRWYKGNLEWNYSWFSSVKKFARANTSFSIDAYPRFNGAASDATVPQLTTLWRSMLYTKSMQIPYVPTTIDEIGIPAQDGAYATPYATLPLSEYPFDEAIQANWFTAACNFMKSDQMMRGIYYWGPWLLSRDGALLSTPDPTTPMDLQPAGQAAIKRCFSS